MRKVWLSREDFALFHQDITPQDYEFFRTHNGAFKRMWQEQTRRFWSIFVNAFEYFIWNYGIMKDFPMKAEEVHEYVDEIIFYIRDQFVDGKTSTARNLVLDCVIVTQNRHCIALLDKASYTQNPFYMKETREIFRQLFGPPHSKRTFMKVLCGLPVYIKFAGAAVMLLRRWLDADDIPSDDETARSLFLDNIHIRKFTEPVSFDPALALQVKYPALLSAKLGNKGKMEGKSSMSGSTKKKKEVSVGVKKVVEKDTQIETKMEKTEKPAEKDADKPAEKKDADKPAEKKDADKPAEKDADKPVEKKDAEKPVEKKDAVEGNRETKSNPEPKAGEASTVNGTSVADAGKEEGEGGGEGGKKKKRRRKKKRRGENQEDGLGLDEELPLPVEVKPVGSDSEPIAGAKVETDTVQEGKTEDGRVENDKVGDGKAEDGKVGDGKAEDGKVGDGKTEDGKVGDGKTEDGKVGDGKAEDGKVGDGKTEDGKVGDGKTEDGKVGDGKTEDGKVGGDKAEDGKVENDKVKDNKMEEGEVQISEGRPIETENSPTSKPLGNKDKVDGEQKDGTPVSAQPEEEVEEEEVGEQEKALEATSEDQKQKVEVPNETKGVEPVAKEEGAVARESCDQEAGKKRLHMCAFCGAAETVAKSFKRCQKCRGKPNPKYYCNKTCQAKHWKTHKVDHRDA